MNRIILFSILILSSCSLFDKAAYEESERQAKALKNVDTSSYWEHQFVTMAKFYEVECSTSESSFKSWISQQGFAKADQEIPQICSSVAGLGEHSGKCMPEQGESSYKLRDVLGKTTRIDFLQAGKRCFADVHILVDIMKGKNKRTVCHKGPSTECSLYISHLERENIKFSRDLGGAANIYFKEIGFRGRLFNFYHFEDTKTAFEEQGAYRSYSSSSY